MTPQRPAALVLVAFALLAAPTPEAVAQAPPRPEPRELWQQFPLETGRSSPPARAEREPTAEVSVPTIGGTPDEGTNGSLTRVQTAAIALAIALVLMLTTGVLAYAAGGSPEFWAWGRRRRLARSFAEVLEPSPVEAPPHAETGRPGRRAKRAAAVGAVASITFEVDALRAKLDLDAAPKKTESPTQGRIERLRERLNMSSASAKNAGTASDEVERLKAKLVAHRAPVKSQSIPPDERERLKEKLVMQPADAESASHDELPTLKEKLGKQAAAPNGVNTTQEEVETLKAKLAKQAGLATAESETADEAARKRKLSGAGAAAKREKTVRAPLETELVDHVPRPTSERKVNLHADTPSPKATVSNGPAKDQAHLSVAVDTLNTSLREPRSERATAAPPVAPAPPVPAAARRRSTIAELAHEYGLGLAKIVLLLIMLALLLLNIAVLFGIGVAS
jgi:hypothetical protein